MLEPSLREYEERVAQVTLFDDLGLEQAVPGSTPSRQAISMEDPVLDALPAMSALVWTERVNRRMVDLANGEEFS